MNGSSRTTPTFPLARGRFIATSLALTLLVSACALSVTETDGQQNQAPEFPDTELPTDWLTAEHLTFERMVEELLPHATVARFDDATSATLVSALQDPASRMRASILLARSRNPLYAEPLLARLELREQGAERGADAADVVAAAGLAEFAPSEERTARLAALASGENIHPDLEVRVECARTALLHGEDSTIPFLLSVLLIGTHQGRESGEFWPAPLRSAWARERAAEILAWRAGLENRYSADASIGDRERETARLVLQLPTGEK